MITDITIGQYFPGDSVVHKMDSRMKIILTVLLIVAIFICKTLPALGVIVVATIALDTFKHRFKRYFGNKHKRNCCNYNNTESRQGFANKNCNYKQNSKNNFHS